MADTVITETLDAGARDALVSYGVRIGYIFDFPGANRGRGRPAPRSHALKYAPEALTGFGIGGIEEGRAPHHDVIRDVFAAAAKAGLHCVPHAGEITGAETVWEAIDYVHAERMAHVIRSMDDPRLVGYLRERQLQVDVSPTSNLRTRCVPSLAAHPLPSMLKAGLFMTLNSDDPPMFGSTDCSCSSARGSPPSYCWLRRWAAGLGWGGRDRCRGVVDPVGWNGQCRLLCPVSLDCCLRRSLPSCRTVRSRSGWRRYIG